MWNFNQCQSHAILVGKNSLIKHLQVFFVFQLRRRVIQEFACENWIEDFKESHDNFMTHKAVLRDDDPSAKVDIESIKWSQIPSSTIYDPFCIECHVQHRKPTEQQLQMYLHCLKYSVGQIQLVFSLPTALRTQTILRYLLI